MKNWLVLSVLLWLFVFFFAEKSILVKRRERQINIFFFVRSEFKEGDVDNTKKQK